MRILVALIIVVLSTQAYAQNGIFNTEKAPPRKGVVLGFNGGVDFPGGDMADRFGTSYRVGGNVFYKAKSNWVLGVKFDYLFGTTIKEDSLMINVTDKYGSYISNSGQRIGVTIYQRGYIVGLQAGKIFNLSNKSSDNGIIALTSIGLMEHKVLIRDRDNAIPSLKGDYLKGYDRLTNGLVLEQYVGYSYFANNNLLNFNIGLNVSAGFTQGRRDYLFDVMRTDNVNRLDLLFGIRAGWYIPIFKRKSEEFFFE